MKFGKANNPDEINFQLPSDHFDTASCLGGVKRHTAYYVGCAKWNKSDLKKFYPTGIKDELTYYASQFNSIELNATFYAMPSIKQICTWRDKTPKGFRFFPKITQSISHLKRLNNVEQLTTQYCDAICHFESKLGMVFLQLHENFTPKDFVRLERFIHHFPASIPLAVEVRNSAWYSNTEVVNRYYQLLKSYGVANILVDTAGRRDMLHMRLSTPFAFVRFVGANHPHDFKRLDDWVERIKHWTNTGLEGVGFFVHQNVEESSPFLAAYFINKLNHSVHTDLPVPVTLGAPC